MNSPLQLSVTLVVSLILLCSFFTSAGSAEIKSKRTKDDLQKLQTLKQNDRELISIGIVDDKEYFVDPKYTNISWSEAQEYCKEFNMTVGETLTAHQDQQVYLLTPLFYNYWLGGTDAEIDGEWRWITDNILFNYTRWGFGEPQRGDSKNCLFQIEDLRSWWTVGCKNQADEIEEIYVLCEKKL